MISIQIDQLTFNNFINELNYKLDGLREITSPSSKTEIAKSIFTISSNAFVKELNRKAKTNPNLSHIYEWKSSGINAKRLFILQRKSVQYGNLVIQNKFKPSTTPVPIKKELAKIGKTGKRVTAKNIFRNKAEVMENGQAVTIRTRKPTPIWNGSSITFIPKGRTMIIKNPGGIGKRGSYGKEFNQWFTLNLNKSVRSSGFLDEMQSSIIKTLNVHNTSSQDIRRTIKNVSMKYSKNKVMI